MNVIGEPRGEFRPFLLSPSKMLVRRVRMGNLGSRRLRKAFYLGVRVDDYIVPSSGNNTPIDVTFNPDLDHVRLTIVSHDVAIPGGGYATSVCLEEFRHHVWVPLYPGIQLGLSPEVTLYFPGTAFAHLLAGVG
jgi:hypothetical protein